ncbi:four helix bundle protein [Wenyingzhuangia sp. 2_MG-2023]|uniref:four helix bundle protein n=1 Tax=Wenyingzhuangia sp. 2_MG-2023 TaxID=3062639 RepID=UPI0026E3DAAD|nr:four helix bundle protein [Wenyingzhuangia sp. 2_MG-2023]MDO6738988.1 four helix bundle protein [Wenyingzhuangia sp. 2_MG-2023]MDO6803480.1 four helix bundle protein [Wenyingzhuangia sp. 1_MG-2023]
MDKSKSFEDLLVWQKGHEFVLEVYKITKQFPKEEIYGLTSQFRRAAVSITANIAEGYKRLSSKEKLRFYNIAQASLEECKYFLILARDLQYTNQFQKLNNLINEVSKMLNAYCRSIANKNNYS